MSMIGQKQEDEVHKLFRSLGSFSLKIPTKDKISISHWGRKSPFSIHATAFMTLSCLPNLPHMKAIQIVTQNCLRHPFKSTHGVIYEAASLTLQSVISASAQIKMWERGKRPIKIWAHRIASPSKPLNENMFYFNSSRLRKATESMKNTKQFGDFQFAFLFNCLHPRVELKSIFFPVMNNSMRCRMHNYTIQSEACANNL